MGHKLKDEQEKTFLPRKSNEIFLRAKDFDRLVSVIVEGRSRKFLVSIKWTHCFSRHALSCRKASLHVSLGVKWKKLFAAVNEAAIS